MHINCTNGYISLLYIHSHVLIMFAPFFVNPLFPLPLGSLHFSKKSEISNFSSPASVIRYKNIIFHLLVWEKTCASGLSEFGLFHLTWYHLLDLCPLSWKWHHVILFMDEWYLIVESGGNSEQVKSWMNVCCWHGTGLVKDKMFWPDESGKAFLRWGSEGWQMWCMQKMSFIAFYLRMTPASL